MTDLIDCLENLQPGPHAGRLLPPAPLQHPQLPLNPHTCTPHLGSPLPQRIEFILLSVDYILH